MKCPLCKGAMEKGETNMPYELKDEKMVVIRGVPALVCSQCGDVFVEAPILRDVESIVKTAEEEGIILGFVKFKEAA